MAHDVPALVVTCTYEGGIEAVLDCVDADRDRLVEWLVESGVMRDLAEWVYLLHGELVAERERAS
jgi:hypothetical protein